MHVHVFDLEDIALGDGDVTGCEFPALHPIPLPDVVYDRYFSPTERMLELDQRRRALTRTHKVFNPPDATALMNDKLRTYAVATGAGVRTPLTADVSDIGRLDDRERLVVKPRAGMKGMGVSVWRRIPGGRLESPQGVRTAAGGLRGRFPDHVIQEHIDQAFPATIRVLVQRQGRTLVDVATYVKLEDPAEKRFPRRYLAVDEYLAALALAADDRISVQDEVTTVAMTVVEAIEAVCPSVFEIAVDVLLDRWNRLWFLEANSKPARFGLKVLAADGASPPDTRLHYQRLRQRSLANVLAHAARLSSVTPP